MREKILSSILRINSSYKNPEDFYESFWVFYAQIHIEEISRKSGTRVARRTREGKISLLN